MKHPIEAFRNPRTRPRALIWTGVVATLALAFLTFALAVTSTQWFCASGCHRIMDGAVNANAQSSHAKVSCVACHLPAGAGPLTFMIHKAQAGLSEVPPAIFGTYKLPLNLDNAVAKDRKQFPSSQCTQCHNTEKESGLKVVGNLKIDHQVHIAADLQCARCHNRVAHPDKEHTDFISMEGCFRCHTLEGTGIKSQCGTCHVVTPTKTPNDHTEAFIKGGHAADVDAQRSCYTCHETSFCTDCHRKGAYPNN